MKRSPILLLTILVVGVAADVVLAQFSMRRVAQLPVSVNGPTTSGSVLCYDCDHDSIPEIIFSTGGTHPDNPLRCVAWEYRPVNRYELVFADTGLYPFPIGIESGNTFMFDVGDIDQDGRTDIVGANREVVETDDSMYNVLVVLESRNEYSFPDSVVWSVRVGHMQGQNSPAFFTPDMDQDGRLEIECTPRSGWFGFGFWECAGDDSFEHVWSQHEVRILSPRFGDFDQDSLMEFVGGYYREYVYENVAPGLDSFVEVYCDTVTPGFGWGADGFTAEDMDQDGRPEFLMSYFRGVRRTYTLCMWEATGNNTYERLIVDVERTNTTSGECRSVCGDFDGDGVDELAWALPLWVHVYKAVANNQFQRVWTWDNDHGYQVVVSNCADLNGNGYEELVVGGGGETSVFEVEAVRVLHPDTSLEFCPGDTCLIRWKVLTPPRCDSVSVFFLLDTGVEPGLEFYQMDTIATGLSPDDSVYAWVVPNAIVDAAWILAMAYGPGWQFDMSDSAFRILPVGMAGKTGMKPKVVRTPTIVGRTMLLPEWTRGAALLDVTGRRVIDLAPGETDVSHVAPGVYFVLRASGVERKASSVHKVVIQH